MALLNRITFNYHRLMEPLSILTRFLKYLTLSFNALLGQIEIIILVCVLFNFEM